MWMNKLMLNPDMTEVQLVGLDSALGNGHVLMLNGVALPCKDQVQSLGILLVPFLVLDEQVAAVHFTSVDWYNQLRPFLEKEERTWPRLHVL